MKNGKYVLIIILYIIISSKALLNEKKVYRFSSNQKDEFIDFDSDNISSDNLYIDILFNIYSKEGKNNKGWILLLNLERNKNNYIKNIKKDEREIWNMEEDNYELIPNLINIEVFEEPNFLVSDFSYCKKNNNKLNKLKYINDYPLIKFVFTKNGIVKIYRPDYISDLDFFELVQFLNKIIFKHRTLFFSYPRELNISNQTEITPVDVEGEGVDNDSSKFSFKDYLREKCRGKFFSFRLFKRSYLGIKLIGKINVYFLKNNTGIINFQLLTRIVKNKEKIIFSYNYTDASEEIRDIIINKIGGLADYFNFFIDKIAYYFPLESIVKIMFKIIINLNIKTLYNNPKKVFVKLLNIFKNELLANIDSVFKVIIDFLNENVIYLKDFIVPFIKKIFDAMFSNFQFAQNFDLTSLKDYFYETKNTVFNKISETYEGIKNSEKTQAFIENAKYSAEKIKETTSNVINTGINKIKDFSNSETAQNIKSTCEDAAKYIGNKFKGFFSIPNEKQKKEIHELNSEEK